MPTIIRPVFLIVVAAVHCRLVFIFSYRSAAFLLPPVLAERHQQGEEYEGLGISKDGPFC